MNVMLRLATVLLICVMAITALGDAIHPEEPVPRAPVTLYSSVNIVTTVSGAFNGLV